MTKGIFLGEKMWGMGTRVPTRLEKRIFHALFFFFLKPDNQSLQKHDTTGGQGKLCLLAPETPAPGRRLLGK